MKGVFIKTEQGFIPDCEDSQKLWDRVKIGEKAMIEHIRGRIYGNHQRFFSFRDVTFDMQETFDNEEIWRKHLIMIAGEFDTVVLPTIPKKVVHILNILSEAAFQVPTLKNKIMEVIDILEETSTVQYWPKSMAFEEMDEEQFKDLFNRAITGFLARYGKGMTEEALLRVIDFD